LISCVSKRVIMSLIKYIERLRRMDSLISMMATGTPEEFAEKMGMKRSTLFESLQEMRAIGVDIKYSFIRQSYYYADNRRIKIRLENIFPEKTDSEKISFS
jgi:biotin operon repressor